MLLLSLVANQICSLAFSIFIVLLQSGVGDLFWRSGWFAKTILLTLLVLSIMSWTITLMKYWQYKGFHQSFQRAINHIRPNVEPNALYRSLVKEVGGPIGRVFEDGYITLSSHLEWLSQDQTRPSASQNAKLGGPEKDLELRLEAASETEMADLASGMPLLQTAVSVSPFLGLLGTVWGVMLTFLSIGMSGSADLSVVAPGIAEALITTIVGLAVAIPALMCNNFLATRLTKIEDALRRLNTELIIYFTHIWQREKAKIEARLRHQRDLVG